MIGVQISSTDTWFFRDGTPFMIEGPQVDVGGVFPPNPPTVVGAIRAAIARHNGWNGQGPWPAALNEILGDGADLGKLSFAGPVLLRDGEPLVPVPAHLLGYVKDGCWHPKVALRPGPAVCCDLGDAVRLPCGPPDSESAIDPPQIAESWWLTQSGLQRLLGGTLPDSSEFVHSNALWSVEPRVGLGRDHVTRTAKEGMLYSTRHIRPTSGVSIGVQLSGLPKDWRWPWGELAAFGGESRLCELSPWTGDFQVGVDDLLLEDLESHGRLMAVALTPLDLELELGRNPGFPEFFGDVELVSACVSHAQRIGGWSFRPRGPLPLRSLIPAGSVLFCQMKEPGRLHERWPSPARRLPPQIGSNRAWGYGVIALATWLDQQEK